MRTPRSRARADGVRHRIGVAVVAAAGDVRGGDQRPDLRFVRSAFAEVGAEIDHNSVPFVSGSSHTSTPPTAKKSAAQVMTTAKLCVFDAAPIANGAAAEAKRSAVVAEALRAGADARREELREHRAEEREVAVREEAEERAERQQQHRRARVEREERDEIVAAIMNAVNAGRRPMRSAIQPKLM